MGSEFDVSLGCAQCAILYPSKPYHCNTRSSHQTYCRFGQRTAYRIERNDTECDRGASVCPCVSVIPLSLPLHQNERVVWCQYVDRSLRVALELEIFTVFVGTLSQGGHSRNCMRHIRQFECRCGSDYVGGDIVPQHVVRCAQPEYWMSLRGN